MSNLAEKSYPTAISKDINEKLIKKYGERSLMYTTYPNSRFWSEKLRDCEYRRALKEFFGTNSNEPLMLYVHIPHCHKQCLFCTCETIITLNYEDIKRYLQFLYSEIELFRLFFEEIGCIPNFKEVHLGGGSPTYLHEEEFGMLMEKLCTIVNFNAVDEFAMEIDPRHVKPDRMYFYAKHRINRISFGIQDFDFEVQKAVDRVQPAILTERLLTPDIRGLFPNGINFDIICGLPYQTKETIRRTAEKIVEMSPDRICFNYLHMRPDFFPHQLEMPVLPDNFQRKILFKTAMEILEGNGYIRAGYDHFAKHTDEAAQAMIQNNMQWNLLGVTAGRYNSVIGVGIHSISTLWPRHYFKNFYTAKDEINGLVDVRKMKKNYKDYEAALGRGEFPIFRGHCLSDDDLIRREVIQQLRNYFYADGIEIEQKYCINFQDYFRNELKVLAEFVEDGIVEISGNKIIITEVGKEFADYICSRFDVYLRR